MTDGKWEITYATGLPGPATHRDRDRAGHGADTPGTRPVTPADRRAALLARSFLAAAGEATDAAWPELVDRALDHAAGYAGPADPPPVWQDYLTWLAGLLGVPADEAGHHLDELLPGLPMPAPDTRGHGDRP